MCGIRSNKEKTDLKTLLVFWIGSVGSLFDYLIHYCFDDANTSQFIYLLRGKLNLCFRQQPASGEAPGGHLVEAVQYWSVETK